MELSQLNEKLKNFGKLPVVETGKDSEFVSDYAIYKVTDEVYVKIMFYKDSYGGSELIGMQFVKPMEVKVTKFEVI